jgi:hypothetical protein
MKKDMTGAKHHQMPCQRNRFLAARPRDDGGMDATFRRLPLAPAPFGLMLRSIAARTRSSFCHPNDRAAMRLEAWGRPELPLGPPELPPGPPPSFETRAIRADLSAHALHARSSG